MDWLRRIGRPRSRGASAPEEPVPEPAERATPGIATLLQGVSEDRSHSVLDLGPAADSSLRVYSRFARWVRFADLLSAAAARESWATALQTLPEQPERPYDLLFAWNVLDWIAPEERPRLIERLVGLSAPDARLYVAVETEGKPIRYPLRFSLVDIDRMRYQPAGRALPAWDPLLPAEVERLLKPFKVVRAFTSKVGLREYVAVREGS